MFIDSSVGGQGMQRLMEIVKRHQVRHQQYVYNIVRHQQYVYNIVRHQQYVYNIVRHQQYVYNIVRHQQYVYNIVRHQQYVYNIVRHQQYVYNIVRHQQYVYNIVIVFTCLQQGVLVESREEASHVIYPAPPPNPPNEEYFRLLEVRGKGLLVHWWYFPDRWETYNVPNYFYLLPCISLE